MRDGERSRGANFWKDVASGSLAVRSCKAATSVSAAGGRLAQMRMRVCTSAAPPVAHPSASPKAVACVCSVTSLSA